MSETAFNSFVYDRSAKIPLRKTGAKVIVEFRTSGSYQGEYGFDWIRMGDSGRLGDTWYANIMGNKFVKGNLIVDKTKKVYDRYASYWFKTKRFLIPWKTYGKQAFKYIAPVMTLRKGASAKLTLKVEVKEPAARMVYQCQTPGIFKLSKTSIPKLRKGKHTLPDQLIITCLKEFSTDQEINVYAYDANNTKHLAGKLIVKANDKKHQKNINISCIYVTFNKNEVKCNISSSKAYIKKFLSQAYVNPNIRTYDLNLEQAVKNKATKKFFTPKGWVYEKHIDFGSFFEFLNTELSKKYPNLGNTFKIYYINRKCSDDYQKESLLLGQAKFYLTKEVVILQRGLNNITAAHELLHCIGLPHSFVEDNVTFSHVAFKQYTTDNIMDYAAQIGIPAIATWEFQWDAIQNSIYNLQKGKW